MHPCPGPCLLPCPALPSALSRYLLVGSYINGTTANIDVPIGGYYHINVLNQPFSLQHALLETLSEEVGYSNDSPKSMMLLEVAKM